MGNRRRQERRQDKGTSGVLFYHYDMYNLKQESEIKAPSWTGLTLKIHHTT